MATSDLIGLLEQEEMLSESMQEPVRNASESNSQEIFDCLFLGTNHPPLGFQS